VTGIAATVDDDDIAGPNQAHDGIQKGGINVGDPDCHCRSRHVFLGQHGVDGTIDKPGMENMPGIAV